MAKVTKLKAGLGRVDRGTFKCVKFELFDETGADSYADLMTRANDASSGITIEHIREYSRKSTVREGSGQDQVVTTKEEIVLVVQYWQKDKKKKKGGTHVQLQAEKDALKSATGS